MPHAVAAHIGIRTDRWKLIYFPDLDHWELFDLQADPNEVHNLAESTTHAETLATLQHRLELRMREPFTATRAPHLDS